MIMRSAFLRPPDAPRIERGDELGYTPGWDLIAAVDDTGRSVARVVSFVPDRALLVFDGRDAPPWFQGELAFPSASGLGPVRARQTGPTSRHVAGDHVASVEIQGTPLAVARLQLAWLRARVRRGEALPPVTRHLQFEHVRDPDRVARIMSLLRDTEATVTVQGTGGDGPSVRGRMDRSGTLLLPWDRMQRLAAPLRVWACGYNSVYELVWPDSAAFSATPQEIVRVRRRRHRRVAAPRRVTVEFQHPLWPELTAVRSVVDVSADGLAFRSDTADDALFPGLPLTISVEWKRGRRYRFRAVVRHCTPGSKNAEDVCGLSLHPADVQTAKEWHDELEPLLHPSTYRSPDAGDLWDLYAESGYFRLSEKEPPEFAPLHRAFVRQRARLARHPEVGAHFGCDVAGQLQAAVGQIETWTGSWLIFQGARRSSGRPLAAAGDDVLRDLYLHAYEHVAARSEARHLVSFVQDVARFSKRCQHELGVRLSRSSAATVTPFRAIEMRVGDLHVPALPAGITLAQASPSERELTAHAIARSRPPTYVEGTGLAGRRLELGGVATRWRAAGLQRSREVLVARDRGVTEAAIVLDAADDGVHLFRLLDVARFVPLSETARSYLPALLGAAARWYARLRKQTFVYFEEAEGVPELLDPAARDLGVAHCIVLPIELLPEQIEHVFEITAPSS
jgi:hypothetical protein